jgi:hypothetical protein
MRILLIISICTVIYSSYVLFTPTLFGDDNLIKLEGSLDRKYRFVRPDTLSNKKTIDCAYLIFVLRNDKRFYALKLNIDSVPNGFNIFAGVDEKLEGRQKIEVWIKKSAINEISPKVYKLKADEEQIYLNLKKNEDKVLLNIVLLVVALVLIFLYYILNNYHKVKQILALNLFLKRFA